MKIAHIIPTLNMGGAERLTLDICAEITKSDTHTVILIVLSERVEYELPNSFPIYFCKSKVKLSILKRNRYEISQIKEILEDFNPEVIHTHLFESEVLSRSFLLPNVLYVSHVHDNMIQLRKTVFSLKKIKNYIVSTYERSWILKRYNKTKRLFICISHDAYDFMIDNLPRHFHHDVSLLMNSIVKARFPKVENRSIAIMRLISIGSFVEKKNQQFLLDVVHELKKRGHQVSLYLLGDGPLRKRLEEKCNSLNLKEEVVFTGNVNDVNSWLSKSNLYVHSALYEPFGLVLIEAMSSCLPVVSLDGKGNRDIIENGYNGFIIDIVNVDLMVEKIELLFNNQELYSEISTNATNFSSKFDIKPYVEKLINLYESKK